MDIFIVAKSDFGHQFFAQCVVPTYTSSRNSTEAAMLVIMADMAQSGYVRAEEFAFMAKTAESAASSRGVGERKVSAALGLVCCLSEIDARAVAPFVGIAMRILSDARFAEDLFSEDARAWCALLLLKAMNKNQELISELPAVIPAVFSVFPMSEKHCMRSFVQEMISFAENHLSSLDVDQAKALLAAILRYLSRKDQARFIFRIDTESHCKIVSLLSAVVGRYLCIVQNADIRELISSILHDGGELTQYVLSQLNCVN